MENKHTLEELEQLVIAWAEQRGLLDNPSQARLTAQFGKTIEELAELEQSVEDKDHTGIKDAIGDICITLIIRQELLKRSGIKRLNAFQQLEIALTQDLDRSLFYPEKVRFLKDKIGGCFLHTETTYDVIVALYRVASGFGYSLERCLVYAYNQIKDRTGRMINNQFVKDK